MRFGSKRRGAEHRTQHGYGAGNVNDGCIGSRYGSGNGYDYGNVDTAHRAARYGCNGDAAGNAPSCRGDAAGCGRDAGNAPCLIDVCAEAKRLEGGGGALAALWTGRDMQLTVRAVPCGGCIADESAENDRLVYVIAGECELVMGRRTCRASVGITALIPHGASLKITNTSHSCELLLCEIYAPREHSWGTVI